MSALFVTGDIHGHVVKVRALLRDAGLIDADATWTGADSSLWFMGDLVDHGPDGIGAIAFLMRLQGEAAAANGRVGVLLGNHDVLLLAADRFGAEPFPGTDKTFRDIWEQSGGQTSDLDRLTPEHARWLAFLPAMAREGDGLLVHADALFYSGYGDSITDVNANVQALLQSNDPARWARLLNAFGEHRAFTGASGTAAAETFLRRFGGERIVHGHTPITKMTGQPPATVREPLLYASDRALNLDAGLYLGGPGFVYRVTG
ncbi:MAG: metallophosphoesterase [Chloroflexia bacterium]|nr:metallophosphoesterase [Chloroflexia bacterium]